MKRLFLNPSIKSVLIMLILSLFCSIGFSQSDITDKMISVPEFTGNVKALLDIVAKQENVVFAYSDNVTLTFTITTKIGKVPFKQFLNDIFKNQKIQYKSNGNKIILYPTKENENKPAGLKQTVRGTVYDNDTKLPLIGATVVISGSDPLIGTTTDVDGCFRLENIPVGRIDIKISYMGYAEVSAPNIEVISGKEVVLRFEMHEQVLKLNEVTITTDRKRGEATNDLSLLSSRSISVEETKRYTGGMDDPARTVTSYAGVMPTPNGGSDIIVRGNSPKYMQWQLDGVVIASPYHMDDQNASVGTLTALNKYLLTTSDFYTGAFSPEYGNVLSNVMDMKLRRGNNENFEATVGVGLMGTDVTLEGPFKKGYSGSYLVNYRYSTVSLINKLGLLGEDVEGVVNYQDATFKVVLPTKKAGTFSMFGLGGLSGFDFKNIAADGVSTPLRVADASIVKDYDKKANLANLGIINILPISGNSYIRTSLSYSSTGYTDDMFEKKSFPVYSDNGEFQFDSISNGVNTFKSQVRNSTYQAASTYHTKLNARNKIQIGTRYIVNNSIYNQDIYDEITNGLVKVTDFSSEVNSLSNFISWKFNVTEKITLVSGLQNMNVLLNKKSTLEPRIALDWQLNKACSFRLGYGKHSTVEKAHNYFTKVRQPDGTYTEPNKDLDLLMADHYVLGFEKHFTNYLKAKIELYYQHLYNLPVEDNDTSYYATINEGINYRYVKLVNKGVGENYGIEFTLERFFDNNYYFVLNSSLYESKYKTLEGVWRNTMYNGNYTVNLLAGKEFKNLGKKQNKILALNIKAYMAGAQRYIPLLRDANGNVAVDPENNQYWDYSKAYNNDLVHVYNVNLSISYKINRANSTHELFLDLMNVIRSDAHLSEYYDESQPNNIGYQKEMIFLPNLMYRVYF